MSLPVRDETSRLEVAQQRLAQALNRLEGVLARPVTPVAESPSNQTPEDAGALSALHEELAALRRDNGNLEGVNRAALTKIEDTIARLKSVLVT